VGRIDSGRVRKQCRTGEIWAEIEAAAPAGLDGEATRLITAGATYYADLVSHERVRTSDPSSKPVYMVIPYTIEPNSSDEYVKYAQAYVVPQLQGWMREGALAGWDLFVSRYARRVHGRRSLYFNTATKRLLGSATASSQRSEAN